MQALVLDAGFQPISLIDSLEALKRVILGKAEVLVAYDRQVRSPSLSFNLPKIIRLNRTVKTVRKIFHVTYSKHNVHARDEYTCQYCTTRLNTRQATIDHILPKCRGGKNTWENTVTACHPCNNKKDDRTPWEAGMKLIRQPGKPTVVNFIKHETREQMGVMLKEAYELFN
jgi:5-methylcytosine-specific restriction endonuclease McrA